MKPEPNHEKSSHFKMEDCSVCPSDSGTSDPANPPALKKALFQKKTVYRLAALAAVAAVVLAGSDFFWCAKKSSFQSGERGNSVFKFNQRYSGCGPGDHKFAYCGDAFTNPDHS